MDGIPTSIYPDHDVSWKDVESRGWTTDRKLRYRRRLLPPIMEPPVEGPVVVIEKPGAGTMPDEHWDVVTNHIFGMELGREG